MNKQHHPIHPISETDLSASLAESPIIQWISDNGRILLWILLGSLAVILLGYRFFGGGLGTIGDDYFQAEKEYHAFQSSSDAKIQKESLDKLSTILNKYPELQSKYDGLIAQTLLDRGTPQQAIPFAERTLARTGKDKLPLYADFARTSLLVAEKKYDEALTASQELKQKMDAIAAKHEENFGDMLYAFNLVRLAVLHQVLGNKAEELKAWQDFKQSAVQEKNSAYAVNPQAFELLAKELGDGKLSLLNYIETREKLLK